MSGFSEANKSGKAFGMPVWLLLVFILFAFCLVYALLRMMSKGGIVSLVVGG